MPDRSQPTPQRLIGKASQKRWKEWRDFIVIVLAFIGLWHVLAGSANFLKMLL
jgi:nitrate reductase NapE component